MLARAFAVPESEDDKQPRMGKPIKTGGPVSVSVAGKTDGRNDY